MILDKVWEDFLTKMNSEPEIKHAYKKNSAGIPFLYVATQKSRDEVQHLIQLHAASVMKGKRLNLTLIFVRQDTALLVYRMRFLVPQEKMFCCGNLCADCIRLR